MSDPAQALNTLEAHAVELDDLSKRLDKVEQELESATIVYEDFMGAFEEGLWDRHVTAGDKFPAETLRTRMAHRAMPPEMLGRYSGLLAQRKRMEKRIASVGKGISAQQSILSALREESSASSFRGRA